MDLGPVGLAPGSGTITSWTCGTLHGKHSSLGGSRITAAIVRLLVSLALAGCAASGTAPPTASPTPTPSPTPIATAATTPAFATATAPVCIDLDSYEGHLTTLSGHLRKVYEATNASDQDAVITEMRLMVSETRALADAVAAVNPEAERHLLRSADDLESSANSASQLDAAGFHSWLDLANNEFNQAVDAITVGGFCAT